MEQKSSKVPISQNLLQTALGYLEKFEFSVIPVKPDKKPWIKWEPYQKRRATAFEIREWWTRWPSAMIGIVTGSISGIVVIDVDTEEGREAIQKYIPDSVITPACRTPKGGQHLYFKNPQEPIGNNARLIPGCDFRGEGGYVVAPPSRNDKGAYAWLEGLSTEEVEPADLPSTYISFINSYALKGGMGGANFVTDAVTLFECGRRDNDLFHTANCLIKGGMLEGEISQVLERLILSWGENPDSKWIKDKVQSALKRSAKRDLNLAQELRQWVSVTNGDFSVTDAFKSLQSVTPVTKRDTVRQILYRMWKDEEIQKAGKADGVYRRVETEFKEIDFLNAPSQRFDVRWPFQIEKWIKIFPKDLIVIAGEPNAGKSAFMFNVARLNQDNYKIRFLSSEMGGNLWSERLSKFGYPLETWKFKPIECSSNYRDYVVPDALNLFDFLEIHDEFYKLSLYLKEIYEKLDSGIAVVAIQKNKGCEFGLGGQRGLEKPTLYLSIEPGKARIVKAKNWAGQVNPNGLELTFKLVQGCKFIIERDWCKSEGKKP